VSSEFERRFMEDVITLGCKQIKDEFGWDLTHKQYESMIEALRQVEMEVY
jgi:hypothetical protein